MIMGGVGLWVAVGRGFWRSEARGAVETIGGDGVVVVAAEEESTMVARGEKERPGGACSSDTKKTDRIICVLITKGYIYIVGQRDHKPNPNRTGYSTYSTSFC